MWSGVEANRGGPEAGTGGGGIDTNMGWYRGIDLGMGQEDR